MDIEASRRISTLEVGIAGTPLPGEGESGDRYVAVPSGRGVLLGVVDGLGHGVDAAKAAEAAVTVLAEYPDEDLVALVQRCHERLRETRGATMSLAAVDEKTQTLTWLSVGNVAGVLLRANPQLSYWDENILMRGGVVGFQLPKLQTAVLRLCPGDLLILATDGIQPDFASGVGRKEKPQRTAETIATVYSRHKDDSLVLVARYRGSAQ